MALFVAKLLESHGIDFEPIPAAERTDVLDFAEKRNSFRPQDSVSFRRNLERILRQRGDVGYPTPPGRDGGLRMELDTMLLRMQGERRVAAIDRNSAPVREGYSPWDAGAIDVLKQVSQEIPISVSDANEIVDISISTIENRIRAEQAKLEEIRLIEERAQLVLQEKGRAILTSAGIATEALAAVSREVHAIKGLMDPHASTIGEAMFLEGLKECLTLTDGLWRIPETGYVLRGDEIIRSLQMIQDHLRSLHGQSKRVISERLTLITNRFTKSVVSRISLDSDDGILAYRVMKHFARDSSPDAVLEELLKERLIKFKYHFTREDSPLNLVEKPEWPLKWFTDTTSEVINILGEGDKVRVSLFMARKAREYFNTYRWASIKDPRSNEESAIFSLLLGAFLHSANLWKDLYGADACDEFMREFLDDARVHHADWTLLDEWINHDKSHILQILENVRNPWAPSPHVPDCCNIAQALLDVLETSSLRIEILKHHRNVLSRFIDGCFDEVLDEFKFKISRTSHQSQDSRSTALFSSSSHRVATFAHSHGLCSAYMYTQLDTMLN